MAKPLFALLSCLFLLASPTAAQASPFEEIAVAAEAKRLPTKIIRELIQSRANVVIRGTTGGPAYRPGVFGGGTIYLPFAGTPPSRWLRGEWSDFYNEVFHAWWGNVFLRAQGYAAERDALTRDAALQAKYRRAYPRDSKLAQEEAYSETTASVITMAYPRVRLDPDTGEYVPAYPEYETLYYRINWTVAPVGHSDRPGYTPEAESIYPDAREYDHLMRWLFGRSAPPVP